MDGEVEDIVGDVKYTGSQKSVTISAAYSLDFIDSSSDKNNSSGKETYILACDSDESDKTFQLHKSESTINLMDTNVSQNKDINSNKDNRIRMDRSACTSLQNCNIEMFTQTSKTIMELAQNETHMNKDSLETQTSFVSIIETQKVQYLINVADTKNKYNNNKEIILSQSSLRNERIASTVPISDSLLPNTTSSFPDNDDEYFDKSNCQENFDDGLSFITNESEESLIDNQNEIRYDSAEFDSEVDGDSLENNREGKNIRQENNSDTSEVPTSIDNDFEELYNKITERASLSSGGVSLQPVLKHIDVLTPLSEETSQKIESVILSASVQTLTKSSDDDTLFINNGIRVKILPDFETRIEDNKLQLPPITSHRLPHNPNLDYLFSVDNLKSAHNNYDFNGNSSNRWEFNARDLASGESPYVTGKNDLHKEPLRLPPIHLEGSYCNSITNKVNSTMDTPNAIKSHNVPFDVISINGKIKELKMNAKKSGPKYGSRSGSPSSISSPEERKLSDAAERGSEALCCELLRKLRSSSWLEVTETLDDLPNILEKFWLVITENRIADLIRRVTSHIESPRTQVARAACNSLAEILKNTNYTKKPDFYEAVATLLTKTGSYNRPVRRASNVALDEIVCKVDIVHAITAICIYGVGHKNALVRSASARLLVVCCALAEGGRQVLRARPPSAAAARKHTLRALSELLQDKNTDTRKYAERLYAMLRPLQSFEAYFLTDVDVELASRHMKKYDALLSQNKQCR